VSKYFLESTDCFEDGMPGDDQFEDCLSKVSADSKSPGYGAVMSCGSPDDGLLKPI